MKDFNNGVNLSNTTRSSVVCRQSNLELRSHTYQRQNHFNFNLIKRSPNQQFHRMSTREEKTQREFLKLFVLSNLHSHPPHPLHQKTSHLFLKEKQLLMSISISAWTKCSSCATLTRNSTGIGCL